MNKKKESSFTNLIKSTQKHVNRLVRERDFVKGKYVCCSCGRETKKANAGHFIPKGISPYLRFFPLSLFVQCTSCNTFRRGDSVWFYVFIYKNFGVSFLDILFRYKNFGFNSENENKFNSIKCWSREDLGIIKKSSLWEICFLYYSPILTEWSFKEELKYASLIDKIKNKEKIDFNSWRKDNE